MENRCREKACPPKSPGGVIPRCETTFVEADTSSFKQVVQMLTGSDPKGHVIPPVKKQSFKLYERRGQAQSLKNSLILIPGVSSRQQQQQDSLSPSTLDFPNLALNSPSSQPQPQLLPLFPLTSPTFSASASSLLTE